MWYILAAYIVLEGGSFIYHRWLEDKPPAPRPPGLTLPKVDDGIAVPLLYGRCRVRTPILVWYGNYTPKDGSHAQFSVDMLLVLGIPFYGAVAQPFVSGFGTILGMYVGDTRMSSSFLVFPGPPMSLIADTGTDPNNDSHMVGDVLPGTSSQLLLTDAPNVYQCMRDAGIAAAAIPSYRNLVCVSFAHSGATRGLAMPTPNAPSFNFEVRILSTNSASDLGHSLTDDADPAAVIYDLLTGRFGKLGLPTSLIDKASFQAASLTLFNEGHGYSMSIEQASDASSIINDVLRQTDGVLRQDPVTGLITYKLIRKEDIAALTDADDINPDNAEPPGDGWYSVQGWAELPNQVQLTFTYRTNSYQPGTIIAQNPAAIAAAGGRIRKLSVTYSGCNTPELARVLAARELAAVSRPTVKATVKVNRSLYGKRPGDVVTLTWPELGISKMVMRVARANRGRPGASAITLDLIKDFTSYTVNAAFPSPGTHS